MTHCLLHHLFYIRKQSHNNVSAIELKLRILQNELQNSTMHLLHVSIKSVIIRFKVCWLRLYNEIFSIKRIKR